MRNPDFRNRRIYFHDDEKSLIQEPLRENSDLSFMRTPTWQCLRAIHQRCKKVGYELNIEVNIDHETPHIKVEVSRDKVIGIQAKLF